MARCQLRAGARASEVNWSCSRPRLAPCPSQPATRQGLFVVQVVSTANKRGDLVKSKVKLTSSMTLKEFENGYWYATELKDFADSIGVASAGKLRKDELEKAVRLFLTTGEVKKPTKRSLSSSGLKDVERGLHLGLLVTLYTNDKETKDFLEREARKLLPDFKRRSGVRYRLNRWREDQLVKGVKITYRDLVAEYVRLNQTEGTFARIPHGRYINFVSDFLAAETDATRADAAKAWRELKAMDVPKDFSSWSKARPPRRR